MMRKLLFALFGCLCLPIAAQQFDLEGTVNSTAYDGIRIYLSKQNTTNSRQSTVVDSALIQQGKFHFTVPVSTPFVAHLWLPEKDSEHHMYDLPETNCIAEHGKVSIIYDAADAYKTTLSGGTLNAAYDSIVLVSLRQARDNVSRLMKLRQAQEKTAPYTNEQNNAYTESVQKIYRATVPAMHTFIERNIKNNVGQTLFFSYPPAYYPPTLYNKLCSEVPATLMQEYKARIAAEEKAIEHEQQVRRATHSGAAYTDFVSKTPQGETVKLSQYRKPDRILIVDFWASWCVPCRQEIPALKALYNTYHRQGLDIVSVSLDTKRAAWEKAIEQNRMPWPQLSTLEGVQAEAARNYAVRAIPFIVLIDQEGKLALVNMHGEALTETVARLLKK